MTTIGAGRRYTTRCAGAAAGRRVAVSAGKAGGLSRSARRREASMRSSLRVREPLAEGLRREGFEVERAATGAEALAAPPVDLVLLDLRLPDLDGLDVCRELRARSSVPIIVVTARGEEADRVVGLELGADDYVV